MRNGWKILGVSAVVAATLTQFTNCDVYSDSSAFGSLSSQSTCTGNSCAAQDSDMLEIGTANRLFILGAQASVDLGGDCNEAAFATNRITWEILQSGVVKRSCTDPAINSCTSCVNGRFQTNINFAGLGVLNGMQLRVELKGYDANGVENSNPLLARKVIQIETN